MQHPSADGYCSIAIEIVGPYLALLIVFPGNRGSPDRLWVFDWQTGDVNFVSRRTIIRYPLGPVAQSLTYRYAHRDG